MAYARVFRCEVARRSPDLSSQDPFAGVAMNLGPVVI